MIKPFGLVEKGKKAAMLGSEVKKVTIATKLNVKAKFNDENTRFGCTSGNVCLDPSGQRRPMTEKFKVHIARCRLDAWRLGPSGQRCSMTEKFKIQLGERDLPETRIRFLGLHDSFD